VNDPLFIKVIVPLRLSWIPWYSVPEGVLADVGDRVYVLVSGRQYTGVVESVGGTPDIPLSKVRQIKGLSPLGRISKEEIRLWKFLSEYYMCPIGDVFKAAYPSSKQTREASIIRRDERRLERIEALREKLARARKDSTREKYAAAIAALEAGGKPSGEDASVRWDAVNLTPAQNKALQSIYQQHEKNRPALLFAPAGAGKTEIYMKAALDTLQKGRNVLYLVPEIALGVQLERRLEKVFGSTLMTFHSGESIVYRTDVASAMKNSSYVILGTRSALLLPHRNLGLIVVDEEHDTSYKQSEPSPRYNARDAAIVLGKIHSCGVILGSATPSLESIYNCRAFRYGLVTLTQRYYGASVPDVQIIDTVAERRKNGMVGHISRKLIEAIGESLSHGGQVLVLRNRRSYAPAMQCPDCGEILHCERCNVPMSYHKDRGALVCHYCGRTLPLEKAVCPKCGKPMEPMGAGTQKIEEEIAALFPDVKVGRLDGDIRHVEDVIGEFERGETRVLVGTQILSKGFDFENLDLVAVVGADSILGREDFRSDERAVQMLTQLSGRSGRRDRQGRILIQTCAPDHPVYAYLQGKCSLDDFSLGLLGERKDFGYPPYTRMIILKIMDSSQGRIDTMASLLSEHMARVLGCSPSFAVDETFAGVAVSLPYSPQVDMTSGISTRHIRVTLARDSHLSERKKALGKAIEAFEKERKYSFHIIADVDPI